MAAKTKLLFLSSDKLPTLERVRELFRYDPATGWLIRKTSVSSAKVGDRAGSTTTKTRYRRLKIDGVVHQEHRIIWFYVKGVWPDREIDHRDTDESNNRWRNLRKAKRHQQCWNAKIRRDNTSGIKGATWHPNRKKWMARIMANGKIYLVGYFDDLGAASAALEIKRAELHGKFGRTA